VKEKARFHQLQRHEQPGVVTVKLSELDEQVRLSCLGCVIHFTVLTHDVQAKEHDIFDTGPFLRSKVFAANGYKLKDGVIEKRFKLDTA
jgi:DNA replication licensing factor MCM2